MALLEQSPNPPEIRVDAVHFLRDAEAENRVDATLAVINELNG